MIDQILSCLADKQLRVENAELRKKLETMVRGFVSLQESARREVEKRRELEARLGVAEHKLEDAERHLSEKGVRDLCEKYDRCIEQRNALTCATMRVLDIPRGVVPYVPEIVEKLEAYAKALGK